MAYVRPTKWNEEYPDPRPTPRTAGAAYAPSGSAASWQPSETPAASGMPDLLSYVRANGDQIHAASEQKAGDLEQRARGAIERATFPDAAGKPPDPTDAEKVLADLNATQTQAGREGLFGEAPTKGGRGLNAYLYGQVGMQPFDGLRSMYGDLLKNARPPDAPPPDPQSPAPPSEEKEKRDHFGFLYKPFWTPGWRKSIKDVGDDIGDGLRDVGDDIGDGLRALNPFSW